MDVTYTALEKGFIESISPGATTITNNTTQVFSFIWVFGVIACVAAGAAILATSGVRLTAADSGSKAAEIKKDIKRAVYGVLGVLLLWLILNQVNPDLLRGNIGLTAIQPTTGTGVTPVTPTTPTTPGTPGAESNMRTTLAAIPVNINNNGRTCSGGQTTGCTNVAGMRDETVQMLRDLRRDCPSCEIEITGGTEPGHQSHDVGKLPVDLKLTDSLNAFIRKPENMIYPPATFCIAEYRYKNWRFCDEKNTAKHWHVYMR